MVESTDSPPHLQHFANVLSEQPQTVRNLFCYLLVMSMVDQHGAKIVRALRMGGRHYLRIDTKAGEVFWMLRPPISMETELRMQQEVKAIFKSRMIEKRRGRRQDRLPYLRVAFWNV